MNTKLIIAILGIILIIGAIGGVGYYFVGQEILPTGVKPGDYINVPTFMWYKCEKAPSNYPPVTNLTNIPKEGITISCLKNTEECDIVGIGESNTFVSRRFVYKICDKNTNVCYQEETVDVKGSWKFWKNSNRPQKVIYQNLGVNKLINIRYQKNYIIWFNTDGASVEVTGQPFIITKNSLFSGVGIPYTTVNQGCTIPTDDRKNLLNSFSNMVDWAENTQTTTSSTTLAFRETRNFVDNFIPISIENVKFVDNGNGYCINNNVYAVASVTTPSGTYKVVDLNGQKTTRLRPVTCCPGDINPAGTQKCNSNFQWENISGGECSLFSPCSPDSGHPIPSGVPKQLMWFDCEKGYCVKKTATKECTSDTDCTGNPKGSYCDRKTWSCTLVPVPVCPSVCSTDEDCNPCGNYKCESNKCVAKGGGWTGFWDSIKDWFNSVGDWFENVKWIFSIVVGFLGGLVSMLFGVRFITKDIIKENKWRYITYASIFVVLGLAFGFLAWIYFWWIVLALFILLILKIFI